MTDNRQEAYAQLESCLDDMQAFLDMEDPIEGDDENGSVYDYGLEWTKSTTDHINETVTYRYVISTGGPHGEFVVTFGPHRGGASVDIEEITFVSMPWFGREEIRVSDDDTVIDFFNRFFGELVEMDMSREFG